VAEEVGGAVEHEASRGVVGVDCHPADRVQSQPAVRWFTLPDGGGSRDRPRLPLEHVADGPREHLECLRSVEATGAGVVVGAVHERVERRHEPVGGQVGAKDTVALTALDQRVHMRHERRVRAMQVVRRQVLGRGAGELRARASGSRAP
jgi:hypothetical protein